MNQMSTKMNQKKKKDSIEWRRSKVQELLVKGYNHYEIASTLQISRPTITKDIHHLSECAKQNIKKYIDERLPEEYEKCLVGLTAITKEAWNTAQNTEDKREKLQALSLAKECYSMKLDLLTNATVVDDAIRFVSQKSKEEKLKPLDISKEEYNDKKEESTEYDYDDDEHKDHLEEEEEQHEQETEDVPPKTTLATTRTSSSTTNQKF
jgi:Trp operon repressor